MECVDVEWLKSEVRSVWLGCGGESVAAATVALCRAQCMGGAPCSRLSAAALHPSPPIPVS